MVDAVLKLQLALSVVQALHFAGDAAQRIAGKQRFAVQQLLWRAAVAAGGQQAACCVSFEALQGAGDAHEYGQHGPNQSK